MFRLTTYRHNIVITLAQPTSALRNESALRLIQATSGILLNCEVSIYSNNNKYIESKH